MSNGATRVVHVLVPLMAISSAIDLRAADTGTLKVTVREAGGEAPLPCRAWVDAGEQRLFEPASASCTPYKRDRSFSCDGSFEIAVPAGPANVHVERGKEYLPVDRPVTIQAGETAELKVELERWIDMKADGWYSADLHVHFGKDDLRVLRQLALADDVNWLPAFSYWNDFHEDWPAWPEGRSVSAGGHHLVTLANEEIERIGGEPFESVGALFIFGLDRPVYVERHDHQYPPDAALARIAKRTSPGCIIDTDKPLWAENVVTMGLGLFDTVQVCHNHYHREKTIPVGWGMVGSDIEEQSGEWGDDELFVRTNMIYYRWLNCGFRLAVTGGSAIGVMPVPLGYNRTYAKLDGELTEASYIAAIRAGRTFATSGPMLTLSVDGHEVGSTIEIAGANDTSLRASVDLRSIEPIDTLDLVQNGRVVHVEQMSEKKPKPVLKHTSRVSVRPTRSGWVAARAVYRAPDGRLREAHTSPVYVTVDGKPTASKRDAEYMIRWIDRILQVSEKPGRYQSDGDRAEAQALFREARRAYEKIAQTATEVWGDR